MPHQLTGHPRVNCLVTSLSDFSLGVCRTYQEIVDGNIIVTANQFPRFLYPHNHQYQPGDDLTAELLRGYLMIRVRVNANSMILANNFIDGKVHFHQSWKCTFCTRKVWVKSPRQRCACRNHISQCSHGGLCLSSGRLASFSSMLVVLIIPH